MQGPDPRAQPYLLSVIAVCQPLFDVIAWIAKDSLDESCGLFSCSLSTNSTGNQPLISIAPGTVANVAATNEKVEPLLLHHSASTVDFDSTIHTLNSSVTNASSHGNTLVNLPEGHRLLLTKQPLCGELVQSRTKTPNISNALRREVIVMITYGLKQAIERTAIETRQITVDRDNSPWDADFDGSARSLLGQKRKRSESNQSE